MRILAGSVILPLAILVAGCRAFATPDPIVDGWPVGEPLACTGEDAARCPDMVRVGLAELDRRSPGHAAVASAVLRLQGAEADPVTGDQVLQTRSGGALAVLLMTLVDGSIVAVGVGYPGISREAVAVPWGPIGER